MKNNLVKKVLSTGKKIALGASLVALPYLGISQTQNKTGLKYNSALIEGKKYSIKADSIHGTPYLIRETEKSRKNPLGIEVYPLQWGEIVTFESTTPQGMMKGLKSKVTYIPQETGLDKVTLKSDIDSSYFSIPSASISKNNKNKTNPVGSSFNISRNAKTIKLSNTKTPSGHVCYYPFVSPKSNESIENGEMLNWFLIDTVGTKLEYGFDGKAILLNPQGKIYSLNLTKDSDRSKVLGTKQDSISYLVNKISSKDSLTGDLTNYFVEKDSLGNFIYEIPKQENFSIDSTKMTVLQKDIKKTKTGSSSKNKILNPNYPEFYSKRIKNMSSTTGEVFYDEESQTKTKKKRDFNLNIDGRIKVGAGITTLQGYVASINPQIKVSDNFYLGVEGSYTNSTRKLEEITKEPGFRQLVSLPAEMYFVSSDKEVKENTKIQNDFDVALNASYLVSPHFEFTGKVGTIGQKTTKTMQSIGEEYMEIAGEKDLESVDSYNETNTSKTNNPLFKGSPVYVGAGAEYKCKNFSFGGDLKYITGENSGLMGSLKFVYNFLEGNKK